MSTQNDNKIYKEYKSFLNTNIDIRIYKSNITECPEIDCLVNCTGPKFEHYAGISKAITESAGSQIFKDYYTYLSNHRELEIGKVYETSAYNLIKHKYILHIRSPTYSNNIIIKHNKPILLTELIYWKIIKKCFIKLNMSSLACPFIGTGSAGLPLDECLISFINACKMYQPKNTNEKKIIYLVNNDLNQLNSSINFLDNYLNNINLNQTVPVSNDNNNNNKQNKNVNDQQIIDEDCSICLDKITNLKQLDKCKHNFCTTCIDHYFNNVKKQCPICKTLYGLIEGNQPNGTMTWRVLNNQLPGFDQLTKTIEITYTIPSGIQNQLHPNPGKMYHGTQRNAFLPDNQKGQRVLNLLKKAFDAKLIFTVGQSRTTGQDNTVTWNDIHHKTRINGGPSQFGYPDSNYLDRVLEELADKGIN